MSVRVGLVEKKLENASRESEDKIERLQQKLDQSTAQYRRKEKEFEETADALQVSRVFHSGTHFHSTAYISLLIS